MHDRTCQQVLARTARRQEDRTDAERQVGGDALEVFDPRRWTTV
jgi:hypothetical protein